MLTERITNDYKQAMKDKEAVKVSTLSFLRSQIKNVIIEKKAEQLPDTDVIAVIKKQVKQRQDSIEQYEKGGRQDLADKEKQELMILQSYLPTEMSDAQLKSIIAEAVKEANATGPKDMGNVMKLVVAKVSGRADNKTVSNLVRQSLGEFAS